MVIVNTAPEGAPLPAGTYRIVDGKMFLIKPGAPLMTPEKLAQSFHESYERLAPSFGYATREASAKPWSDVPVQNRELMVAVCREMLRKIEDVRNV